MNPSLDSAVTVRSARGWIIGVLQWTALEWFSSQGRVVRAHVRPCLLCSSLWARLHLVMRTAQRLEVLLITCQPKMRCESPSRHLHMEHRCRKVRSRGWGGGHQEAFPLASLPLSLSSPMSKADGATAPCVCVCVLMCRGTCKCRLMRHTQLDTHTCSVVPCPLFCLQQNVCCVRLWAVNTRLPSLNNWLYIVALKWNIPRCWF